MVEELRAVIREAGGAPGRIHSELFHADPAPRPPVATLPGERRGPRTSRSCSTGAAPTSSCDRTTYPSSEAALRVRSDLPFACKGGVCGTCRAKVVEGSVAMDVNYALEPDEVAQGYVLTCQSHPTAARVVLDYDA